MQDLILHDAPNELIERLAAIASRDGVSIQEEHRRLLKEALQRAEWERMNFKELLMAMPYVGEDEDVRMPRHDARAVEL